MTEPKLVTRDGQWILTIADAPHGTQEFRGDSVEQLCLRLADAQGNATRKIRELNRELKRLRHTHEAARDVVSLLTALLLTRHTTGDKAPAIEALIRQTAKEIKRLAPEEDEHREKMRH
jgi:hypothetical protein